MKSFSLDSIYMRLEKHVRLVQSYLEIDGLSNVFKACRLKPCDFTVSKDASKLILFKKWFDEFGNSLEIHKGKLKITYNDLSLDRNKIVCTDLYYGLTIDRVAKISKMMHLVSGKDEDKNQPYYSISFVGLDNYLRSYIYLYGSWQPVAPLLFGIKTLLIIMDNSEINYFRKLNNKEKTPIPCQKIEQWLVSLPASDSFLSHTQDNYAELKGLFE